MPGSCLPLQCQANLRMSPLLHCEILGYTAPKPKGPVLENTTSEAVAAPTDKRGIVMPKFRG